MRRTAIRPAKIYELAQEFLNKPKAATINSKGGRPRLYDDALVLTIACVQNLHQFSYREALEFCGDIFPTIPTLSTYHYRLKRFSSGAGQEFIEFLGKKITETAHQEVRFFIVDGTGFSFDDVYPMNYHRGMEIRKIRAHVKVAALARVFGNHRFALSASAGRPYASELHLSLPLIEKIEPEPNSYVLGDKGFDCIELLRIIRQKKCHPVIPAKSGRRMRICDQLRILSNKNAQNHEFYSKRTLIEGLFGNTKQKLSSHIKVFKLRIAKFFALLRLALFNMSVLVRLERKELLFLWFSNIPLALDFMVQICYV